MSVEDSITIKLYPQTGAFAENKDIGRDIRLEKIEPALAKGKSVVIDFDKIEGATQSFIHSLISQIIRDHGSSIIERLYFQHCADEVKTIISIVIDYMQESD